MADLDPVGTAVDGGFEYLGEAMAVEVRRIEDRVEHYSWIGA